MTFSRTQSWNSQNLSSFRQEFCLKAGLVALRGSMLNAFMDIHDDSLGLVVEDSYTEGDDDLETYRTQLSKDERAKTLVRGMLTAFHDAKIPTDVVFTEIEWYSNQKGLPDEVVDVLVEALETMETKFPEVISARDQQLEALRSSIPRIREEELANPQP